MIVRRRIASEFRDKNLMRKVVCHTIGAPFDMKDGRLRGSGGSQKARHSRPDLLVSLEVPDILVSTHFRQRKAISEECGLV